eukprot:TRINITY_DN1781_c0_g1_i1.p1 TRINITY_DN1781_c0_g1~~TRINITY_DN1781_c0_g1_i1.p1  ORF type:complete len:409 (-),score=9.07 TRINITY_DN1781_c0_g1_i1:43-1269(-)
MSSSVPLSSLMGIRKGASAPTTHVSQRVPIAERPVTQRVAIADHHVSQRLAIPDHHVSQRVPIAERPVPQRVAIEERPVPQRVATADRPVTQRDAVAQHPVTQRDAIAQRPVSQRVATPIAEPPEEPYQAQGRLLTTVELLRLKDTLDRSPDLRSRLKEVHSKNQKQILVFFILLLPLLLVPMCSIESLQPGTVEYANYYLNLNHVGKSEDLVVLFLNAIHKSWDSPPEIGEPIREYLNDHLEDMIADIKIYFRLKGEVDFDHLVIKAHQTDSPIPNNPDFGPASIEAHMIELNKYGLRTHDYFCPKNPDRIYELYLFVREAYDAVIAAKEGLVNVARREWLWDNELRVNSTYLVAEKESIKRVFRLGVELEGVYWAMRTACENNTHQEFFSKRVNVLEEGAGNYAKN